MKCTKIICLTLLIAPHYIDHIHAYTVAEQDFIKKCNTIIQFTKDYTEQVILQYPAEEMNEADGYESENDDDVNNHQAQDQQLYGQTIKPDIDALLVQAAAIAQASKNKTSFVKSQTKNSTPTSTSTLNSSQSQNQNSKTATEKLAQSINISFANSIPPIPTHQPAVPMPHQFASSSQPAAGQPKATSQAQSQTSPIVQNNRPTQPAQQLVSVPVQPNLKSTSDQPLLYQPDALQPTNRSSASSSLTLATKKQAISSPKNQLIGTQKQQPFVDVAQSEVTNLLHKSAGVIQYLMQVGLVSLQDIKKSVVSLYQNQNSVNQTRSQKSQLAITPTRQDAKQLHNVQAQQLQISAPTSLPALDLKTPNIQPKAPALTQAALPKDQVSAQTAATNDIDDLQEFFQARPEYIAASILKKMNSASSQNKKIGLIKKYIDELCSFYESSGAYFISLKDNVQRPIIYKKRFLKNLRALYEIDENISIDIKPVQYSIFFGLGTTPAKIEPEYLKLSWIITFIENI